MKSAFLTIALLFGLFTDLIHAQVPYWQWAESGGVRSYSEAFSISSGANGNLYVTGQFTGSTLVFGTDTLTNAGGGNVFIVKYDSSGNERWAKNAGGRGSDGGNSICIDANGSAFLTGYFESPSIAFGMDTLVNNNTGPNVFIVKYDSSGNVIWAQSAGGTSISTCINSTTDAHGDNFITGYFEGAFIVFGNDTLINNGNNINIFIVKYDPYGNVVWAKSTNGTGDNYGYGISADVNGNAYVTGYFDGSTIVFGTDTLTNTGGYDVFIVKYDSSGNIIWAKSANGSSGDEGPGIGTDLLGNVYIGGNFTSPFIVFGGDTLTNKGSDNIFIVKYNPSGNIIWAKSFGGINSDEGRSINVDAIGNVYVTGDFSSPNIVFGTDTLINNGMQNIFIVKCDTSGNVIWAKSVGGTGSDYGNSISVDGNGCAYITGQIGSPNIVFGNDTLANIPYGEDLFVAKMGYYPLGISSIGETDKITIYPNPSNGIFYLSGLTSGNTIEIYDLLGQSVTSPPALSKGEGANSRVVDLSGRNKGIYFYRVTYQGTTVQQGKLVLE